VLLSVTRKDSDGEVGSVPSSQTPSRTNATPQLSSHVVTVPPQSVQSVPSAQSPAKQNRMYEHFCFRQRF